VTEQDAVTPLVLDLLAWLADGPRRYEEVMDAWRSSCPRLTIWEDAVDLGYVDRRPGPCGGVIEITARGRDRLAHAGRHSG